MNEPKKVYKVYKPWDGHARVVMADLIKEGSRFWTIKEPVEGIWWGTKISKDDNQLYNSPLEAIMGYMGDLSNKLKEHRDKMLALEKDYGEAKEMLLGNL